MKTLIERSRNLSHATTWLQLAADAWANSVNAKDFERVRLAGQLAERAVRYTQALQAFVKGGAK